MCVVHIIASTASPFENTRDDEQKSTYLTQLL